MNQIIQQGITDIREDHYEYALCSHLDKDGCITDVVPVPSLEGLQQLQTRALGVHLVSVGERMMRPLMGRDEKPKL